MSGLSRDGRPIVLTHSPRSVCCMFTLSVVLSAAVKVDNDSRSVLLFESNPSQTYSRFGPSEAFTVPYGPTVRQVRLI